MFIRFCAGGTGSNSWWVAVVGDVQVEGAPHQEKRWGLGVVERCDNDKRLLMRGGVRTEERTKNNQEIAETCGAGNRIKC